MGALRKAKAALIAHAASEQWQLYKSLPTLPPTAYFQPGALPCPDLNNDGDADCAMGSSLLSMIGRVPYKTMGIDDLRDASGERIWYALSHDFRKNQCPGTGCTTINSDTLGQLTVTGMAPATQVVAIVFAPGAPLDLRAVGGPLQDRIAGPNDPTNYLENFNLGDNIHFTFTSTGLPTDTSNDRLLVITQADLMAAVEPVVAARIERDIKPLLRDYFNKWGAYPFPVPFGAGPPDLQSAYQGVSPPPPPPPPPPSFTHGLLPLKDDATFTWASAAVTQLVGHPLQTGTPVVTSSSCTTYSSPFRAVCQINYDLNNNDRPVIVLEIFLGNANVVFADTPSGTPAPDDMTKITMVDNSGDPLASGGPGYGQWSFVAPYFPPTRTFVARAAGGALTYTGRLQPAASNGRQVTITVLLPSPATNYLPVVSGNPGPGGVNPNPNGAWFIANQWYKQTYYAVSPGYAPGGVPLNSPATCSPLPATPACLRVNNLPAPFNDKGVILVLAGRALNGSSRPSGTIANYLEGANLSAANDTTPYVYEHRAGIPTAINDRVVVVSPP
jgi:hypothetical protein